MVGNRSLPELRPRLRARARRPLGTALRDSPTRSGTHTPSTRLAITDDPFGFLAALVGRLQEDFHAEVRGYGTDPDGSVVVEVRLRAQDLQADQFDSE
jgi:hypothetical protein